MFFSFFKVVLWGKSYAILLAEVLTILVFSLQPTMSFPVLSIYRLTMGHGGKPWVSDFNDPNYLAGRAAMKRGRWLFQTSVKILQPWNILLADHEAAMLKKLSNFCSIAMFFWLIIKKRCWRNNFFRITSSWSTKRTLKKQCLRNDIFSITFSRSTKRTLWCWRLLHDQPKEHCDAKEVRQFLQHLSYMISQKNDYGHKICVGHTVAGDSCSGWTSPTFSRWPWKRSCHPSLSTFNLSLKVSLLAFYQDSC